MPRTTVQRQLRPRRARARLVRRRPRGRPGDPPVRQRGGPAGEPHRPLAAVTTVPARYEMLRTPLVTRADPCLHLAHVHRSCSLRARTDVEERCHSPKRSCDCSSRWSAPSSRRTRSSPPPCAAPRCGARPAAARSLAGVVFVLGVAVLMAGAITAARPPSASPASWSCSARPPWRSPRSVASTAGGPGRPAHRDAPLPRLHRHRRWPHRPHRARRRTAPRPPPAPSWSGWKSAGAAAARAAASEHADCVAARRSREPTPRPRARSAGCARRNAVARSGSAPAQLHVVDDAAVPRLDRGPDRTAAVRGRREHRPRPPGRPAPGARGSRRRAAPRRTVSHVGAPARRAGRLPRAGVAQPLERVHDPVERARRPRGRSPGRARGRSAVCSSTRCAEVARPARSRVCRGDRSSRPGQPRSSAVSRSSSQAVLGRRRETGCSRRRARAASAGRGSDAGARAARASEPAEHRQPRERRTVPVGRRPRSVGGLRGTGVVAARLVDSPASARRWARRSTGRRSGSRRSRLVRVVRHGLGPVGRGGLEAHPAGARRSTARARRAGRARCRP